MRFIRYTAVVLLASGLTALVQAEASDQDTHADNGRYFQIEVPLADGELAFRDLLISLCEAVGIEGRQRFSELDWTLDVKSTLGRLQLGALKRITGGAISAMVQGDRVVVRLDRKVVAATGDQVIRSIERWVGGRPDPTVTEPRFGMTVVTADDPRAPIDRLGAGTTGAVVLVHGLDDPGWMWRDLTARLLETERVVVRFEYPNDQPIADSTDFFAWELMKLRSLGVDRIQVVAHSMGGLVTRDLLTRRAYYDGDGSGGDLFPAIDRLLMLGTPNHGSKMVWLRGLAELREQVYRWVSGTGSFDDALTDGLGEAGRDLRPDSDFLRRLNARPQPQHTTYTIIAGRVSPLSVEEIESLTARMKQLARSDAAPQWLSEWAELADTTSASSMLDAAIGGLGDGVVTIESARLAGVDDFVVVEGNHISMIANLSRSSDRMPPAIELILDRLGRGGDDPNRPVNDD
ncbi:MAG: alpha/beta hydrolase [Planctomycetes bacterium]|nr:alpha/beta hydrolase [Planctomycetota bacterium]